jgi:transketolase
MGAILNGLSLSKIRTFGSGFLIFSDYGRAPIRLGALMEIPVIHIFTHDSIGVGKMGRHTSQSSIWHVCARSQDLSPCDQPMAMKWWRHGASLLDSATNRSR